MDDLRFMIVNSNLQHSQALKSELDSRVSFDVYQDTEEKNVWGLMQGGKDDVYVYDRCGRLAYYIPFPFSIMAAEDNLVRTAIIATYFGNPCGDTCNEIGKSSLEDVLNANTDSPQFSTEIVHGTSFYPEFVPSNTSEEVLKNETVLIENNQLLKPAENDSDLYSSEDFDYPVSNNTEFELYNLTHTVEHKHNDLPNFFLSNETIGEVEESYNTSSTNDSISTSHSSNVTNDNPILIDVHHIHSDSNDTEIPKPKPKNLFPKRKLGRCAEADLAVCKNWSKRRLLRAQTCCFADQDSTRVPDPCKNYGKKRCKKIRTILKCCIKTEYVETTTTELTTVESTTTVELFTEIAPNDVTCCTDNSMGQMCRVSVTGSCESGEYVQEQIQPTGTPQTENTD